MTQQLDEAAGVPRYAGGVAFSFPIMLDLDGVPVLLVGGGAVATRKGTALLNAGAALTVVAPVVSDELAARATRVERRGYVAHDIAGHRLVFTATDDAAVNAAVARDATDAGVWVNSADDPSNCSFALPAIVRSGSVVVAVGTDGSSPALAQHLRDRIAATVVTPAVGRAAADLAAQRDAVHAAGGSTETIDWSDRVAEALLRYDHPL